MAPCLLCFQKALVFVGGGAADVAHSCQFTDVELPVLVGGIVAEKGRGASGRGRQDASLFRQAQQLPGTATGKQHHNRDHLVSVFF